MDRCDPATEARTWRGDHGAQLPVAGDLPRRRRRYRRFAGAGAGGGADRRRIDRHLRRPLHGRNRQDPGAGPHGTDPRPRGRLFARKFHHRRGRQGPARAASGRPGGHLRQHQRRGEGRVRCLLHLGQRRAGGRGDGRGQGDFPARQVPRQPRRLVHRCRTGAVERPLRSPRTVHRATGPAHARTLRGARRRASGMPAGRAAGSGLRWLHHRDGRLAAEGATAPGGADHRMLDGRQPARKVSGNRVREALQPLPAHEADHAAEHPRLPSGTPPSRRGSGARARIALQRMLEVGRQDRA